MKRFQVVVLLSLPTALYLLTGCSQVGKVPTYAAAPPTQELPRDKNGWVRFPGLQFKGTIRNGTPDGVGQCRTDYFDGHWYEGMFVETPLETDDPCEFRNGDRVDPLHALRMKRVAAAKERQARGEVAIKKQIQDDARRRDREAAAATERALQGGLQSLRDGVNAAAVDNARQMNEVRNATQDAIALKQQKAEEDAARKAMAQAGARPSLAAAAPGSTTQVGKPSPTTLGATAANSGINREPEKTGEQENVSQIVEIRSDNTTGDACTQAVMIASTKAEKLRNWSTGDYVQIKKIGECKCESQDSRISCNTSFEFTPVKASGGSNPGGKNK